MLQYNIHRLNSSVNLIRKEVRKTESLRGVLARFNKTGHTNDHYHLSKSTESSPNHQIIHVSILKILCLGHFDK